MTELDVIKSKFDDFVKKYKEFCIDKILTDGSNNVAIDGFVNSEIENENSQENCLDELNDVSEIIEKLFESEETFIKGMNSDIAKFNELYNCYKYGNLDDPGIIIEKKTQISGEPGGGGGGGRGVVSGTGRGRGPEPGGGRDGGGGGGRSGRGPGRVSGRGGGGRVSGHK